MKTITKGLLAGIMAACCCCSIANAQISYSNSLVGATLIYSNAFNGAAVNISNTPPNYINAVFGGSNNAVWLDALGVSDTNAFYANGNVGTSEGDSIILPFAPQSNHVYTLTASVTFSGNPGNWVGAGWAQNYATPGTNNARYADSGVNGYDFSIITESSGNVQSFAGPHASVGFFNQNGFFPAGTGTRTMTQILDTTSNKWIMAAFVDGVQAGTNIVPFTTNPALHAVGLTQSILTAGGQSTIHWNSFTLSAAQLLILQQPASTSIGAGAAFTNRVQVAGTPPFFYQWYTNGVAQGNATNSSLIFNPVIPSDSGVTYSVVVTNVAYGAVTSAPASMLVYTTPLFASEIPVTYTNPITLFGGTNSDGTNYFGSTPTFAVSVIGGAPLAYQWYTNGVPWGGQTNTSLTFTNAQLNGPTNFAVIVTNAYGSITNAVSATYIPTPQAQYPQSTLSLQPVAFWRLNEQPDDGNGNNGRIFNDYDSGNNGLYTNVVLDQAGYNSAESGENSVFFGTGGNDNSYAGAIAGLDFAAPIGSNANFTVDAWVNGVAADSGASIIGQGLSGVSDAFSLGADTSASRFYEFYVRSANGTVYKAGSTIAVGADSNWHHLVGVCNESGTNVALYIDGHLISVTLIPAGSGVFESSAPIAIGAGTQGGVSGYNVQFFGNIADVGAYNYALSAGQVAGLFGGTVTIGLVAPLPPTNGVYIANETLTIPATAFGAPPSGYYWTNVTVGGIVASGKTNVLQNLNATLIISNAPVSLSGDVLELVVTNATSSTNWFVTLFSPPPPVTLSYSSDILYTNEFYGGNWAINGMPVTGANSLLGGTNTTWTDALGTNDVGAMLASGVDESSSLDSWELPFTPEPGYIYTLTAQVTFNGSPGPNGDWIGMGFAQRVVTNAAVGFGRFSDGGTTPPSEGPNGYDWILLNEASGNVQDFGGPGGQNSLLSQSITFSGSGTHTLQVVLNTTNAQWVMSGFADGIQAGTNYPYPVNPPIGAVGITQTTLATPSAVQWDSFSLTAVAPGGVAPFLLAPLPPSSISLTNPTVSIPVTAFGSGPFGYSWTFNNSTLASGTTNNMAPLSASLTVPSSSLGGGQLQLTVTNAFGTNITLVTLVSPINPNPTNIITTVTNNNLYLTWPVDHTGWQLQAQTNSVSVGISNNWINVVGSTTTNQVVVPVNPANGTVFYRLLYNP